jgi:YgiT-type zinc finger domain-containing protein
MAQALAALAAGFVTWDQTHPGATLSEVEGALDAAWACTRADLIASQTHAQPAAHLAGQVATSRPRCPACGTPVVADGQRRRTLTLAGNQPLTLEHAYTRCPQCGGGSFPPG